MFSGWDHFDSSEVGFKELFRVYELVTQELGQEAIVVDADDLLKHPGMCINCTVWSDQANSLSTKSIARIRLVKLNLF